VICYELRVNTPFRIAAALARCPSGAGSHLRASNPPLDGGTELGRATGSDKLVFKLVGHVRRGHGSPEDIGLPQRGQTRLRSDGMLTTGCKTRKRLDRRLP
jgi:hypothetical protein